MLRKFKTIPYFDPSGLVVITLPEIEDWKYIVENKINTPYYSTTFWTRTPGDKERSLQCIGPAGLISPFDWDSPVPDCGVRPVFRHKDFDGYPDNIKIYIGKLICTTFDGMAISDSVLCHHQFDEKSSDYDKSSVREFLNSPSFKEKYIMED